MADSDKSLYNLRYNQLTSNLEGFGGGSPQWTLLTLNNVDPQQVPVTRQINTTTPLQGGGNLTVDRTLSILQATNVEDGYLSSVDWNTFNNKQVAGNYITALTGDATASGPGSVPLTLATVNGNVGTFALASITVNGKGLITSASSGATGSLTDVGTDGITITNGTGAVIGSGTSISQHVADTTHNGYLSSTDWNTFNSKESATLTNTHIFVGNASNVPADVALSGDATLANTGAMTLATVNSNVGSFTNATLTVNGKGLVTAASSGAAPVTSVSGTANDISSTGGTTPVLDLVNTAVTPASYTNTNLTVDAKGRITAASSGTAPVTSVGGTTNQITSTGGATPVIAIANPVTFPGAMTAGGALAMASNKITGLANGTASTDAMAFGQNHVFQIVTGTSTTQFTTTANTFQTTNLTATITPTSSSSKIIILASSLIEPPAAGTRATIARGGTNILASSGQSLIVGGTAVPCTLSYLDSPASTSSLTYSIQIESVTNGQSSSWGEGNFTQSIILIEVQ